MIVVQEFSYSIGKLNPHHILNFVVENTMLIQKLSVCFLLIYSLAFGCDKVFVVGQYSNDYFDSQNAISNDAYYYSNGRQYNDPEPDTDIGATVLIESSINKISYVFNV